MRGVRQSFLHFFEAQGHTVLPSASLIPHGDSSLLFTNAGMVPLKTNFLVAGQSSDVSPPVVSVQRCVRAGGKHNDLEQVGHSANHMTMFQMLGNFSFGSYWKLSGDSMELRVQSHSTVRQLKAQLVDEAPMQDQHILLAGVKLQDDRTIQSYNVMPGDVLQLVATSHASRGALPRGRQFAVYAAFSPPEDPLEWRSDGELGAVFVFTEHVNEKHYWSFPVGPLTTGAHLTQMVKDANICGPSLALMSRLDVLRYDDTLRDAGVKNFDKLFCFEAVGLDESMMVKICLISHQILEIHVSESQTFHVVKEKVKERTGIPVTQQHLLRDGVELDDRQSISASRLQYGVRVQLELVGSKRLDAPMSTGAPVASLTRVEPTLLVVSLDASRSMYSWSLEDLRDTFRIDDKCLTLFDLETCAPIAGRCVVDNLQLSFYPEELLSAGRSLCLRVNPNLVSNLCGLLEEPHEFFHTAPEFPLLVPVTHERKVVAVEFDRAHAHPFRQLKNAIQDALQLEDVSFDIAEVNCDKDAASLDEQSILTIKLDQ